MILRGLALLFAASALAISLHTKYKERERRRVKEVADELKEVQEASEFLYNELTSPRSHEDNDLWLNDIARETLVGAHESDTESIQIFVNIRSGSSEGNQIDDQDELFRAYKNGEMALIGVKVGSLDELYATSRNLSLHSPIRNCMFVYERIDKIEGEYGDIIDDFDDSLLDDLEKTLDRIVHRTASKLTQKPPHAEICINEFDDVDEIGEHIFESIFYYEKYEDDLEELTDINNRIEEFRRDLLQASYS